MTTNKKAKMDPTKVCIGIDLGTTNTSVAYSEMRSDGSIELRDLEIVQRGLYNNNAIMSSILYIDEKGEKLIGHEAEQKKEQDIAWGKEDIRFFENTKRYMGSSWKSEEICGRRYSAKDVAAEFLKYVYNFSIKQEKVEKLSDYYTIITVPANFNTDQRNDTLAAADMAGLKNVELYDEPKAAILSFLHEESIKQKENKVLDLSTPKRILVIDIGGGTCDISVEDVQEKNGNYYFTHKAVGRENLGGIDFDRRIGEALIRSTRELDGRNLRNAEKSSIIDVGRKCKESISSDIQFELGRSAENAENFYKTVNWLEQVESWEIAEFELSRTFGETNVTFKMDVGQFVKIVNTLIYNSDGKTSTNKDAKEANKNLQTLIHNTLDEFGIDISGVDYIFLTGGMAKCFPLQAALYDLYRKEIICPKNPFLAVSRGAALVNKYSSIDLQSDDLMNYSIMLEMQDGSLQELIRRGEKIPIANKEVSQTFYTTSRSGVVIQLYEGKSEFDCELRKIRSSYTIEFDEPRTLNRAFKIKYSVDSTKRIHITIIFVDSGETYEVDGQAKMEEII